MSQDSFETRDLDTIVKFARRKGYVFPSSEIYGGYATIYDFGPLGSILKKNIEAVWRHWNIGSRTDMEEIEGAIFMHPKTWEASGHVGGFSDVLVEDLVTHKRYRADHLLEDANIVENADGLSPEQIDDFIKAHDVRSPEGNELSGAKRFNLLVKTHLGATEDSKSLAYLKGESCQNIYLNWKSVQETTRRKLPFGIAQQGKAFRNEITVGQFLFRGREFEQADVQYFCKPEDADALYQDWKEYTWNFYVQGLGLSEDHLRWRQHEDNERAFYARDAWDIEFKFGRIGFKEIGGLHDRSSYDLDQHSKFSGEDLSYFDPTTNERFNPFIIEASLGVNRMYLAVLYEYYSEETVQNSKGQDETRIVFKLPYSLAPYKIAVLPLMKKDGLAQKGEELFSSLRKAGISATYDETASVGKRYRRQDEAGTPLCATVDYQTLEDNTVTVRHRDTMEQVRVSIDEIMSDSNLETLFNG